MDPAPVPRSAPPPEPASHPHEAKVWWVFAALLAVVFGALSHWRVFEYDLFWEARAGEEILGGSGIQRVDTWSHTAYGSPWYNFQWLSMVAIHVAARVGGGFGALAGLRSVLVALWIFQIACLVRRGAGKGPASFLAAALLIPSIYIACSFRLQMRPDLFGANAFAALMLIWSSALPTRKKRSLGIAVLILWANLHSGTMPFGLLSFAAFVALSDETPLLPTLRERAAWIAGGAITSLLTPLGYRVYGVLGTALSYDYEKTKNPDFRPFGLELLHYREAGAMMLLWALYAALAFVACVALRKRAGVLPGSYRSRAVVAVLGAALTFMVLQRIRSIHYQVVFLVPIVAAFVGWLVRASKDAGRFMWRGLDGRFAGPLVLAAVAVWSLVLPDHVQYVAKPIGSGVSQIELPVASVEFLRRVHPTRNLLNAFPFGGYAIQMLRELPVSVDGREFQFERFRQEMREAEQSPATYAAFLREHDINTVLATIPATTFDPKRGFVDGRERLLPSSEWAQVFFDDVSVVYLRRTPEHAPILAEHEFRFLQRGLPSGLGATSKDFPDTLRAAFETEVDRCLRELPDNVYCLAYKAAYRQARHELNDALSLLRHAERINPRSPETLLVLGSVYGQIGDAQGEARTRARFERLTMP